MFLEDFAQNFRGIHGLGPKKAAILERCGLHSYRELLQFYPSSYQDRRNIDDFSQEKHQTVTKACLATVVAHQFFRTRRESTLKIELSTPAGHILNLLCYRRPFLAHMLPVGTQHYLYADWLWDRGVWTASHFDTEPYSSQVERFLKIVPQYPSRLGLSTREFHKYLQQIFSQLSSSWQNDLPLSLIEKYDFYQTQEACWQMHFPQSQEALEKARRTLVYREFFLLQLSLASRSLSRIEIRTQRQYPSTWRDVFVKNLPFELSEDQKYVENEILQDLASPYPMARLLQGDVGCGKTLVAWLSALPVLEAGFQVALLAPTEILARQHYQEAQRLLAPLGLRVAFLSGRLSSAERQKTLEGIKTHAFHLVIGTHALFSQAVHFSALQYVIIDEQHRFGVEQRQRLLAKGHQADILLMSATPIPRTLALSVFGDLKISTIKTMPSGRKPITTYLSMMGHDEKLYRFIDKILAAGEGVYFVYPLIDESEQSSLRSAEKMVKELEKRFPSFRLGLLHSRIPEDQKVSIIDAFGRGELHLLVATTVIEVGIHVPHASCIVIEHAERFGLAALHQLRGRVGRGKLSSYAFFVYDPQLSDLAKERLRVLSETQDGFVIAEQDLILRGPGDFGGLRQAGYLSLNLADWGRDAAVLLAAHQDIQDLHQGAAWLVNDLELFSLLLSKQESWGTHFLS